MDLQSLKDRINFRSPRKIGVEWEYNSVAIPNGHINNWKNNWNNAQVVKDGSCGLEAITPPIQGHKIDKCLTELFSAFVKQKARIDDSCGTHTHVDANDLDWLGMRRLIMTYIIIEPLMYLIGGQHRAMNHYSAPCASQYARSLYLADKLNLSYKTAIMYVALGFPINNRTTEKEYLSYHNEMMQYQARIEVSKKGGGRYRGLNIMPWLSGRFRRRPDTTVEFRIHRNAKNPDRMIAWAKLCAEIVDFAVYSNDNVVADFVKINTSALRVLCQVAPKSKDFILKRIKEWRNATKFDHPQGHIPRRIKIVNGKWVINGV